MKRIIVGLILVGSIAAASPALAQTKPFSFSLGGGVTVPVGGVTESLGTGGQIAFGLTFPVTPKLGVTAEYGFSSLGSKSLDVPQPRTTTSVSFEGSGWFQYFGGSLNYTAWTSGKTSAYLLGGFGAYHRSVYVTTPATGMVTVCDPNWFVCFPTAVTVDTVVGSRGTNDPGVSIGGGITYKMSNLATFFAEARFHQVWGPQMQTANGGTKSASAQFFPLTFGLRF
ncbi:MAG: outer membrane beta-barrel protein [Acidobacteria bacterium]|nr:outer membrane beta-barrel protein [Acidobacteriota bacterium]